MNNSILAAAYNYLNTQLTEKVNLNNLMQFSFVSKTNTK